jgi:hypothetical protein
MSDVATTQHEGALETLSVSTDGSLQATIQTRA